MGGGRGSGGRGGGNRTALATGNEHRMVRRMVLRMVRRTALYAGG